MRSTGRSARIEAKRSRRCSITRCVGAELSDKADKSHTEPWKELEPLFDAQLEQCSDSNFEFSAIAGAYIANLHYMSPEWVHANLKAIFPIEFPANCLAAFGWSRFRSSDEAHL